MQEKSTEDLFAVKAISKSDVLEGATINSQEVKMEKNVMNSHDCP